jgi:ribosomal protein S19
MSRSLKKLPYLDNFIIKKLNINDFNILDDLGENFNDKLKKRVNNKIFFILKSKNLPISKFLVGLNFLVYNGKKFIFLSLKDKMVKHKIGEFVITKTLGSEIHLDKKKRKR